LKEKARNQNSLNKKNTPGSSATEKKPALADKRRKIFLLIREGRKREHGEVEKKRQSAQTVRQGSGEDNKALPCRCRRRFEERDPQVEKASELSDLIKSTGAMTGQS